MTYDKQTIARAFAPLMLFELTIAIAAALALSAYGVAISQAMITYIAVAFTIAATAFFLGFRFLGPRGFTICASVAAIAAMMSGSMTFSYACIAASAPFPLIDEQLAAIDSALGFDWRAHLAFVGAWPLLASTLAAFYHKTILGLLYVIIFLWIIGRPDRLLEFFWLFMLTAMAANLIALVAPAAGAFVHYAPSAEARGTIASDSGVWHLAHFNALRDGTFALFEPAKAQGLITFPSFHTAGALLIPIALRGHGPITIVAGVAAAVIALSTLAIGGHYLIDVVAGAIIAFTLLPVARRFTTASFAAGRRAGSALQPAVS